jgi:hypothetical protein
MYDFHRRDHHPQLRGLDRLSIAQACAHSPAVVATAETCRRLTRYLSQDEGRRELANPLFDGPRLRFDSGPGLRKNADSKILAETFAQTAEKK